MYDNVASFFCTPSFTLWPSGDERSRISRHLSGLFFLGITPNGLQWTPSSFALAGVPTTATLFCLLSPSKYWATTSGCSAAETMFVIRERRVSCSPWYPILNPCSIPRKIKAENHLSGWSSSSLLHASSLRGVCTTHAAAGSWLADPEESTSKVFSCWE